MISLEVGKLIGHIGVYRRHDMSEIPSASDIQPLPLPKHLIPPPASLLILRDSSCDAMLANAHFSTAQV